MKFKKSFITLLILIFSIFIFGNVNCYAAVGSFSLNKSTKTLKKGKSTTATLTVKNCEGTFAVTSSDSSIATVSITDNDSDGDGWITNTATIKITAKKKGNATISITATDVADTDVNEVTGTKNIKVTVEEDVLPNKEDKKEEDKKEENKKEEDKKEENTKEEIIEKSSTDATLKNLGITPTKYDFSGFKKATTDYSVTVPYEAEKISIYASTTHANATVTGVGSKTLDIGVNIFKIKVTAEDKKTTKTYTLNITREKEATISTDATLKNLGITPTKYDFSGFRKMTTSYEVKVPFEAEKINIYADPSDDKATVTGEGSKSLDIGVTTFKVKVTAEDKKTTKIYTLKITREEEKEVEEDNKKEEQEPEVEDGLPIFEEGISNIEIDGYNLSPSFSKDIYEYNVNITSDTKSLDIKTEKNGKEVTIDIAGNEDLKSGENLITILVYNGKFGKTTTYQIIANVEDTIDLTDINNSITKVQGQLTAKKSIIIGTLIIIVMLIIIFIIKRNKILSKNEFLENNSKLDRIDLSKDESMFERINENTEVVKKKKKKSKGKRFK